ncbi:hypothetical protein BKA60DRAFT_545338 [Fusarium oxysporum]|nr:hypothetical protein BKA60DRAFT_545338 [Fusarium oxysporum]
MVAATNQETVALAPIIVEQTVDRTAIASLSVIQVLALNGPRKTNVLSMFVVLSTDIAVLYTHINFAFATINPKTFLVEMKDKDNDSNLYERLTALKKKDPDLKIYLTIRG